MGQSIVESINPLELGQLEQSVRAMETRIRQLRDLQGVLETRVIDMQRNLREKRAVLDRYDMDLKVSSIINLNQT